MFDAIGFAKEPQLRAHHNRDYSTGKWYKIQLFHDSITAISSSITPLNPPTPSSLVLIHTHFALPMDNNSTTFMTPEVESLAPPHMNYTILLQNLVSPSDPQGRSRIHIDLLKAVLQTLVVAAEPLTPESCQKLLGLRPDEMQTIIDGLRPAVKVKTGSGTLEIYSRFRDQLLSQQFTSQFHLDEQDCHATVAALCLSEMESYQYSSASPQLQQLPPSVKYACLHVMHHIKQSRDSQNIGLATALNTLLRNRQALGFWIKFYEEAEGYNRESCATLQTAAYGFQLMARRMIRQ